MQERAMSFHHPIGMVGLAANTLGSLMLLWYPPDLRGYQPDGSWHGWFAVAPTPEGKREYASRREGYQLSVGLIALGFFLQLFDMIVA
jgi:hypothetical protein